MAIEPAAISANPAVTIMPAVATAPVNPAASAKGTVRPSAIPITISRTTAPAVKCRSMCLVCGIWETLRKIDHLELRANFNCFEAITEAGLKLPDQHQHADQNEEHCRNSSDPFKWHVLADYPAYNNANCGNRDQCH